MRINLRGFNIWMAKQFLNQPHFLKGEWQRYAEKYDKSRVYEYLFLLELFLTLCVSLFDVSDADIFYRLLGVCLNW